MNAATPRRRCCNLIACSRVSRIVATTSASVTGTLCSAMGTLHPKPVINSRAQEFIPPAFRPFSIAEQSRNIRPSDAFNGRYTTAGGLDELGPDRRKLEAVRGQGQGAVGKANGQ